MRAEHDDDRVESTARRASRATRVLEQRPAVELGELLRAAEAPALAGGEHDAADLRLGLGGHRRAGHARHALLHQLGQRLQRRDRVAREQPVDVRHRGLHAARQRLVARVGGERVEPHDAVGGAAQPRHLLAELLGVAAVPAVGQQDDERAAPDAAAVLAVERRQRVADPRAARPVRRPPRRRARARGRGRGRRARGVTRVSRVPNANASTRARAATQACTYWSSIRAYGAIEPETSSTSTSRRGRCAGAR